MIIVMCPKCRTDLIKHDGKATIPMRVLCHKCNKLVTYFHVEQKILLARPPERTVSSGLTFY